MNDILVSVCCLTYNHGSFIKECLDGFLKQKTSFRFEVLIHDDASTDQTAEIIRQYEEKYPDIIKPIYQTQNQYSKGIKPTFEYNLPRVQGKYIAICEGDDYWTDHLKLQKQVDFLEAHPEYSSCVGGFRIYNEATKETKEVALIPSHLNNVQEGYTYTLEETKKKYLTTTLTLVFRNYKDLIDTYASYKIAGGDALLNYLLLQKGKGYYFNQVFGVYRHHGGGVWSTQNPEKRANGLYEFHDELYRIHKDEWNRFKKFDAIIKLMNIAVEDASYKKQYSSFAKLTLEAILLCRSYVELKTLVAVFISKKRKNK